MRGNSGRGSGKGWGMGVHGFFWYLQLKWVSLVAFIEGIYRVSTYFAIGMVHFSLAFTYENPVARFSIVMVMVFPAFVFFYVLILVIVIVIIFDIVIGSSSKSLSSFRHVIVIVIAIVIYSFLTALVCNISWRIKLRPLNVGRSSGQFFQQSDITLYLKKVFGKVYV